jgi:predicted RNase H-like HicB family nuclease
MTKQKYVYWRETDAWLGYLEQFPDYWTQGATEDELKAHLVDLYKELTDGSIPNVRKLAELEIA